MYRTVAATARFPTHGEVAAALGCSLDEIVDGVQRLAEAHVLVLNPGTTEVCWAPPFSAVVTPFRVRDDQREWHAPCAWDAFGIPAALHRDATIEAHCAWSGEPLPIAISDGRVNGSGLIHLEVPARRFWDDIFYT